jgi:ubiquinone biosynthesis protein
VLTRFGFSNVVSELGLERLWGRGMRLIGLRKDERLLADMPLAERVRRVVEQLGPTFIKVGQILSTRPDLIPPDWAKEFRSLQTNIPPVPWERVEPALRSEFPSGLETVFQSIEEKPFAAASMAQVHRAVLADGRPVMLKILRPGIRAIVAADMEIIGALASLMQVHFGNQGYDPVAVVNEFETQLKRETDLLLEGYSTDRMRADFEDNPRISFPRVHWEASTSSVLALEEVQGTLLADLDIGELSPEQRQRIVQNSTDAVFHQCLNVGFFHADPHPGNIYILSGERICLIDAGMTGTIDPGTAELLADLIHGAIDTDLERVVRVATTLTGAPLPLVSDRKFRADVWKFMAGVQARSLSEVRFGRLLDQFFKLLRDFELRCPADLMYLIKAISTIEGVAEQVDPTFDVVTHVRPYIEQLVMRRFGLGAIRKRIQASALGYAELVENLPYFVRDIFRAIQQDTLSLHVEHKGLELLPRTIESASMNVSYALLISSMVIGSSVLLLAGSISESRQWLFWLAGLGFLMSFGLAVFRLAVSFWHRR